MKYEPVFWKKNPFLKLLIPFICGILIQWNTGPGIFFWLIAGFGGAILLLFFYFLPVFSRLRMGFLSGLSIFLLFTALGALLTLIKDARHDRNWIGHFNSAKDAVIVSLREPLVEKARSYKADAEAEYIIQNGNCITVKGKIILYFRKDSSDSTSTYITRLLSYGSKIIFKRPLQEIQNAGNPGGFDYKRYCLFHGITHQVFLKKKEYEILPGNKTSIPESAIFATRKKILRILQKNIPGEKERSLAEALLIGYKDDLEQSLVQSYTNTGVVHIIAISGLHLGIVYWLLSVLLKPLSQKTKIKRMVPFLTVAGIWAFSLLAGAQPSVLRAAFMFTLIVTGQSLNRKSSVYNTLAVSAFLLLCINPFWLWDVGFQLSYAAVLSIVIFMRPIYNWFYFKNKLLDFIWKLNAVTLAAQVLTLPVSIFHFHQVPTLFMLANCVAVPLSGIILIGEIIICSTAFIPAVSGFIGKLTGWCIWFMNTYIERVENIPGSLWDRLYINTAQTVLLFLFIAGTCFWLMGKKVRGFIYGLVALLGFFILRSASFIQSNKQQKIIVYNVPQKRALDLINGRRYHFAGDTTLLSNGFARNFHLKPSRILNRVYEGQQSKEISSGNAVFEFCGKKIMLIANSVSYHSTDSKTSIDLLVISKNPTLYLKKLAAVMLIKQVVFDASNPPWKVNYWKRDCDSLHIPWHDVTEKGAYVMKIN